MLYMLQKDNEITVTPHQFLTPKTAIPTPIERSLEGVGLVERCSTVRPLLSVSRFEIGKFCSFWQLPLYPDTSNQKIKFFRNRIRQQLLPVIKLFFNPKIENTLLQFAEITEAEDRCIDQVTQNIFFLCDPVLLASLGNKTASLQLRFLQMPSAFGTITTFGGTDGNSMQPLLPNPFAYQIPSFLQKGYCFVNPQNFTNHIRKKVTSPLLLASQTSIRSHSSVCSQKVDWCNGQRRITTKATISDFNPLFVFTPAFINETICNLQVSKFILVGRDSLSMPRYVLVLEKVGILIPTKLFRSCIPPRRYAKIDPLTDLFSKKKSGQLMQLFVPCFTSSVRADPSDKHEVSVGGEARGFLPIPCVRREEAQVWKQSRRLAAVRSSGMQGLHYSEGLLHKSLVQPVFSVFNYIDISDFFLRNRSVNRLILFFPRFSVPIGVSVWLCNKRVCTTKSLKKISKKGIECVFLETSPHTLQIAFSLKCTSDSVGKSAPWIPITTCTTKRGTGYILLPTKVVQAVMAARALGILTKLFCLCLPLRVYAKSEHNFGAKLNWGKESVIGSRNNKPLVKHEVASLTEGLLPCCACFASPVLPCYRATVLPCYRATVRSTGMHRYAQVCTGMHRYAQVCTGVEVKHPQLCRGLLSSYPSLRRSNYKIVERHSWVRAQRTKKICFQPNLLKLNANIPKVGSSCNISQQKKVENFFIRNFFIYFDTFKPEKKDLYWPLVISFLPTAFQRRIIRFLLLNQNWTKIRYAQVKNFLTKKTIF